MTENTIRIVLVDDDPLVRAGLGLILGGSPDLEVVAEAADGVEAVQVVAEHKPDIVLMDIRMPRRDGIAATAEILARPDAPRVVVLTTFDSDDMVLKALQAGASGFLLKDTPPPKMVEAIRAVDCRRDHPVAVGHLAGHRAGDEVGRRRPRRGRAWTVGTWRLRRAHGG